METEKRLIDANALSKKIGKMKFEITHNRGGYKYCDEDEKNEWNKLDSFDSLVCDAPTVDAIPVVRCKDCKHYKPRNRSARWDCKTPCCMRSAALKFPEDGFCSYGERKDDGK